jgi:hypothetical protein
MEKRGGAHRPAWRKPCDGSVPSTAATPMQLNPPTTSEAPLSLVRFPSLAVLSMDDLIEGVVNLCMWLGLHLLQLRRYGSFQLTSSLALSCCASNPSYQLLGALLQLALLQPSPFTWGFPRSPTISPELSACLGKEAGQEGARPGFHLGHERLYLALVSISASDAYPPPNLHFPRTPRTHRTLRSLNLNHSPPLPGLKVWFLRTARSAYPQSPSWTRPPLLGHLLKHLHFPWPAHLCWLQKPFTFTHPWRRHLFHILSPTPSQTSRCRTTWAFFTGWSSSSDRAWMIYNSDCSNWMGRPLHSSISSPPSREQQRKPSTSQQKRLVGANRSFQRKVATWGKPCTWMGRLQQQWIMRMLTRRWNGEEHLSKKSSGTRQPMPPGRIISQMYDPYGDSTHVFSLLLSALFTVLLV